MYGNQHHAWYQRVPRAASIYTLRPKAQQYHVAFFYMIRIVLFSEPFHTESHCLSCPLVQRKKPSPQRDLLPLKSIAPLARKAAVPAVPIGGPLPAATHTNLSRIIKA